MKGFDDDTVITEVGASGTEAPGAQETDPPGNPIPLQEHKSTDPFPLSKVDAEFIEKLGGDAQPLTVTYTPNGTASIHSSSYVGVTTLPSGTKIEVTPKETVSRLLFLLQYAFDVPTSTIERTTELKAADTFIDAFGSLFQAELSEVLRQGIRRDYKRIQSVENTVRGRLDVQKQIRRPTPIPTDFAIEYDTFTPNTTLNRAIHAATERLTLLVEDETLSAKLSHQASQLEQFVSPGHVAVQELDTIEITRLNEHYEDLLNLTRMVLAHRFFEDIKAGRRESFGLFINMNSIFEAVVERTFRDAAHRITADWTVEGQANISNLIRGPHSVDMTPDFIVRAPDEDETVLLVGDAKWKTGKLDSGDVYQITSYMLADNAPGVLVYPQGGDDREPSHVQGSEDELSLRSVVLPTAAEAETYQEYRDQLIKMAETYLHESISLSDSASLSNVAE